MQAKDIMTRRVFTVGPQMTLGEVAQLFIDRAISGAPVVDERGDLLGVISQTDLVRRAREAGDEPGVPAFYRQHDAWIERQGFEIKDPDRTRARDVMTPAVITADERASVEELATLMLSKHLHRVVITRGGRLAGIVSTMDMMRALLAAARRRFKSKPEAE